MTTWVSRQAWIALVRCAIGRSALALGLLLILPRVVSAQSSWELTPYRIQAIVSFAPAVKLDATLQEQLISGLVEQADTTLGAHWELQAVQARPVFRNQALRSLDNFTKEDLTADDLGHDKVVVIVVEQLVDCFRIRARQYDGNTGLWTRVLKSEVRQTLLLRQSLFNLLLDVVTPLARIEVSSKGTMALVPRGAGLPPRDPGLGLIRVGDIFQPVLRKRQRDGRPRAGSTQVIEWTYLVAHEASADRRYGCKLYSGIRSPLAIRKRSLTELLAEAVRPSTTPTLLELRARTDANRPLIGYEVLAQATLAADSPAESLGVTNAQGALSIPRTNAAALRMLVIQHGSQRLARFPLVPGLAPTVTAKLSDDDLRLQIQGQLAALGENLVDLVARREVLFVRMEKALENGDLAGAQQLLDELKKLPTREQFVWRVKTLQKESNTNDRAVQAQIDAMFNATIAVLPKYLDSAPLDRLQAELEQAQSLKSVATPALPLP